MTVGLQILAVLDDVLEEFEGELRFSMLYFGEDEEL